MEANLNPILTVVLLFFFGLISPGPNFFVVVQTALTFGRTAGFVTAMGAVCGDAFYAAVGLFGVTRLAALGPAMIGVEVLGGSYLAWLGARMLAHRHAPGTRSRGSLSVKFVSARAHFWRGLATDLANPKTVVFFAGIFALVVSPATTGSVRGAMLLGIVLTSVLWRFFLSIAFSSALVRKFYERTDRVVERVFGGALCFFGALLIKRAIS